MRLDRIGAGTAGIVRASILAVVVSCVAASATERPQTGLLWRKTDLPSVFPLQIRTLAGLDYHVHLSNAENGAETLAAYLRGGEFFRVLVPPGRYNLRVAYGIDWGGEAHLFGDGPETGTLNLPDPMVFRVTGLSRKSGHQVDLRGGVPDAPKLAGVSEQALCQSLVLDLESLRWLRPEPPEQLGEADDPDPHLFDIDKQRYSAPRYDLVTRLCP